MKMLKINSRNTLSSWSLTFSRSATKGDMAGASRGLIVEWAPGKGESCGDRKSKSGDLQTSKPLFQLDLQISEEKLTK